MELESLVRLGRTIRVIGFDDAPFYRSKIGKNSSLSDSLEQENISVSATEAALQELAPASPRSGKVYISGVVCAGTRFEGMVWGQVQQDGWDATDIVCQLLIGKIISLGLLGMFQVLLWALTGAYIVSRLIANTPSLSGLSITPM